MPDDNRWFSQSLDDKSRQALFDAVNAREQEREALKDDRRNLGFMIGAGGILVGLMFAGIAAYVQSRVPPPQASGVAIVDVSTGQTIRTVASTDAPSYYPERVRQCDIEDFISACEGYIPQIWATTQWHSCMIRATPEEQVRREKDIGKSGERYPVKVLGVDGWAYPTSFQQFIQMGVKGTGPNAIYSYKVRYTRTEKIGGLSLPVHWSADISFAYHPELKMSPDDARNNRDAFQAISFSTVKD